MGYLAVGSDDDDVLSRLLLKEEVREFVLHIGTEKRGLRKLEGHFR